MRVVRKAGPKPEDKWVVTDIGYDGRQYITMQHSDGTVVRHYSSVGSGSGGRDKRKYEARVLRKGK